ncbi:MAG: hypothetical protein JRF57_04100 [Deltaproteobacteria bacterium]|nr:hypothetical protein [Deltaproteobacteria bacterium]
MSRVKRRNVAIESNNRSDLPAVLFPHVFLPEETVGAILTLFRPLTLFLPWYMDEPKALEKYREAGILRILHPPEEMKPRDDFHRLFEAYKTWCRENPDRGYTVFLQVQQGRDRSEDTIWGIRDILRRMGGEEGPQEAGDPGLLWHLLLHMAREMEAESLEADRVLKELKERRSPLQDVLELEGEDAASVFDDLPEFRSEPSLGPSHWARLIEAWLGLFRGQLQDREVLVTFDRRAWDHIFALMEEGASKEIALPEEPVCFRLPASPLGEEPGNAPIAEEGPLPSIRRNLRSLFMGPKLTTQERMEGLRRLAAEIERDQYVPSARGVLECRVAAINLFDKESPGGGALRPLDGRFIALVERKQ